MLEPPKRPLEIPCAGAHHIVALCVEPSCESIELLRMFFYDCIPLTLKIVLQSHMLARELLRLEDIRTLLHSIRGDKVLVPNEQFFTLPQCHIVD
jgi:hypothetical protein